MSLVQSQKEVITFAKGILGFENYHQFYLIETDEFAPFATLQCVDNDEVSFVVADPFSFYGNYAFDLSDEVQAELSISDPSEVMVLGLVIVSTNPIHSTMNLMAPLIINRKTHQGVQHVMHDSAYGIRNPLFKAAVESGQEG